MTKFVEMGFASEETRKSIADLISTNAEWFDLLNEVIRSLQITALKACETVKGSPSDKLPLSLLVLHRANGHLQGAAILLERGMVVEAQTLLRSLLETALIMVGLRDNYETVKAMLIEDMDAAIKGQAKIILKQGITHDIEKLEERIKKFGRVQNLSIDKLAELGPLKELYLLYRILSNEAAHPSSRSLRRHMGVADDTASWNGYLIGPSGPADVAETADQLIMTGIALGISFQQMVEDIENNKKLGEIAERYSQIRDVRENAMQGI